MSLRGRLKRLERSRQSGSCGTGCPPVHVEREEDWYGGPCDQGPASCPRCGRPATVIRLVFAPNFYGNADRLRELTK